jgi:small subunit ribosomal protein S1
MIKNGRIKNTAMFTENLLDDAFKPTAELKAELDTLYGDISSKFKVGNVLTGKVIFKDNSGILVNINYKSDGFVPSPEFSEFEFKKIALNDDVEVLLDRMEDINGCVVLSYEKAKSLKAWDRIAELAASDEPVRGVVTHKVKGGLSVDIGIPAFLPGSQVDTQRVNNFDQFVGQEITCKILKVNRKRGNVIVSRRKYLEEQRLEDKKKALEVITDDQVLQGIVKNITNYGVFVDVGGIDGLLHITDMSWGRIAHPSELVKIGDTITVKVISFDKKHAKISLGIKQLQANPWEEVEKKYPLNSHIKGRISSITDYGLFVEIEKGVEGLIHISEISWTERIYNLSKHFNINDMIDVSVVAIDKENRRMSLSIKQLIEDPWKIVAEKFHIGDRIKGKINNITDFGLFVQLHDGVDGLVHISDISWTEHIIHPTDKYKKGDEIEAVILSIDTNNKRVSLGIKQLERDPWENIEQEYPSGKLLEGSVSKVTNFGAFVKFPNGIEGLVHISELSNQEVAKVEDILKVGQNATFKVIKSSREERKLGISLRAVTEPEATEANIKATEAAPAESFKEPKVSTPKEPKTVSAREPKAHKVPTEDKRATRAPEALKGSLQEALEALKERTKKSE